MAGDLQLIMGSAVLFLSTHRPAMVDKTRLRVLGCKGCKNQSLVASPAATSILPILAFHSSPSTRTRR